MGSGSQMNDLTQLVWIAEHVDHLRECVDQSAPEPARRIALQQRLVSTTQQWQVRYSGMHGVARTSPSSCVNACRCLRQHGVASQHDMTHHHTAQHPTHKAHDPAQHGAVRHTGIVMARMGAIRLKLSRHLPQP